MPALHVNDPAYLIIGGDPYSPFYEWVFSWLTKGRLIKDEYFSYKKILGVNCAVCEILVPG